LVLTNEYYSTSQSSSRVQQVGNQLGKTIKIASRTLLP
jgi:hypothetical protein